MIGMLRKLLAEIPPSMQWALLSGMLGVGLLLPTRLRHGRAIGSLLVAISGGLFAYSVPLLGDWTGQAVLWLVAAITLGAAVATIASRSPVYSAIWFALSLLGTAGLFLFQGAPFLAGATVVVYAGAIVVTFLFVIMLAQPAGHSRYDRLTWGGWPKFLGVAAAGLLVGTLTIMQGKLRDEVARPAAFSAAAPSDEARLAAGGIRTPQHVANLGRHLFGEHLLSVEIAGTLLLVALVGAVAIAIQGRPRLAQRIEEALR